MAVSDSNGTQQVNQSSVRFTLDVGEADTVVLVWVPKYSGTTVDSVTFDGNAMSEVGTALTADEPHLHLYRYDPASTGTGLTVSVTWSGNQQHTGAWGIVATGRDLTDLFRDDQRDSGATSNSVTSTTDDDVISGIAARRNRTWTISGFTEFFDAGSGTGGSDAARCYAGAYRTGADPSTTATWVASNSTNQEKLITVALKPAAAANVTLTLPEAITLGIDAGDALGTATEGVTLTLPEAITLGIDPQALAGLAPGGNVTLTLPEAITLGLDLTQTTVKVPDPVPVFRGIRVSPL